MLLMHRQHPGNKHLLLPDISLVQQYPIPRRHAINNYDYTVQEITVTITLQEPENTGVKLMNTRVVQSS